MSKEIKILIPETKANETVDIKVMTKGKELVNYRLEVLCYDANRNSKSRAEFVKEQIDNYPSGFEVVEIGLDSNDLIPVLFRQLES